MIESLDIITDLLIKLACIVFLFDILANRLGFKNARQCLLLLKAEYKEVTAFRVRSPSLFQKKINHIAMISMCVIFVGLALVIFALVSILWVLSLENLEVWQHLGALVYLAGILACCDYTIAVAEKELCRLKLVHSD